MNMIKVAAFHYPPFTIKTNVSNGVVYSGLEVNIIRTLAESLGKVAIFSDPTEGGMWNGVQTDITSGAADVGMGQFFSYHSNFKRTRSYDIDGNCFIVKRSAPPNKWTAIGLPFDSTVWVATLLATLSALLFVFIWKKWFHPEEKQNLVLFIIGVALNNSCDIKPSKVSIGILVLSFTLGTTILSSAYSGCLLTFLTIVPKGPMLRHLDDLIEFPGTIGTYHDFAKELFDRNITRLIGLAPKNEILLESDTERQLVNIAKGEMAKMDTHTSLEYLIRERFTEQGQTQMYIINECWQSFIPISFLLKDDFEFGKHFDRKIQQLLEAGLVDKWKSDEMDRVARRALSKGKVEVATNSLAVGDLLGPFAMLLGCILMCVGTFLAEMWFGRR